MNQAAIAPTQAPALEDPDEAPRIRRLHCRFYDDCLEVAAARRWPGFSCEGCQAHRPRTPEEEYWDMKGLVTLGRFVVRA